ncbi:alpha/beta fold hydrolase [Phytoactinopolyspora halotolerans]|uniref:Alpha/beta hydrolase n=1 Tax=Phytoactinopolyspora halotolerans TaxID=1981512 RepID=A0A6L9S284_9ACTN|nr:alpha/beta hydrolase [Phytoactinopolyspora halotolerans]NED99192.1 alpha/beta hydrolase [Phytoactinopolyspora halotolerans]
MTAPAIAHRYVNVDGVRVFYRETGPAGGLPLLLLHGFPTGSHQYRRLMDALGDRYRMIAPDYPGFGHTETPDGFSYTFDRLADVTEGFTRELGLDRFVLYMFDFGAPVGFRLATRDPDRIAGLIVQNANAYDDGLSDLARTTIHTATADEIRTTLLAESTTRSQYEEGTADPSLVDPSAWTLDQHFLDRPGRADAQVALALDYRTNVALYPQWQAWLREHRPPTLIVWGSRDPFFTADGARAYLRDLPGAELHLFETGHFALEEHLADIATLVSGFMDRITATAPADGSGVAHQPSVAGAPVAR